MGACSDVKMDNEQGIEVVTNGSGEWESQKKQLTLTKGNFGTIEVDEIYKVTDAGGASPPPKGRYKCLESSPAKKRFTQY